jgi:ferrous iron transport protein B
MAADDVIRVALAGNPNSGKTSIFNALTGAHQRVGNYPGVTVERRDGSYEHEGRRHVVVDLPGTYSLTSWSPEERVAQEALVGHLLAPGGRPPAATGRSGRKAAEASLPDVVVVVVDSSCLDRSLVLLAQVVQTGANPVLCLNMSDEARAAGQELDLPGLATLLGFPVVETVGHRRIGIAALKDAIRAAVGRPARARERLVLGERLEAAQADVAAALAGTTADGPAVYWVAQKLILDEAPYVAAVRALGEPGASALAAAAAARSRLEAETGLDAALFVTEQYYGFVAGLLREVTRRTARADARVVSDRIDAVLVHRVLGLPIFLAVLYGIFWLTFSVGEIPMGWIEDGFAALGASVSGLWPEGSASPLRSLLVDGVIAGVGGVLVFLPNILLLFLGLAVLEDTGYMARAAFLMDRALHRFGLHGQSFVPLVTGFGCSIPGILATRTLRNERDRLVTMMVLPLMSCGARLPIWLLLVPAFFPPELRAPALWGIYVAGVLLALLLAVALRRTVLRGEDAPFVMELPPYRLPTARAALLKMAERGGIYARKAGTVILGLSVLLWAGSTWPRPDSFEVDAALASGRATLAAADPAAAVAAVTRVPPAGDAEVLTEEELAQRRAGESLAYSVVGRIGHVIEPALQPMGLDWKVGTALVGAFAAKEVFVSQMGIVYALGEVDETSDSLREALRERYPPLAGAALMLFLLVATPCMATFAVTRRESGSWRWAAFQFVGLTAVGYLLAVLVYQVGSLLA